MKFKKKKEILKCKNMNLSSKMKWRFKENVINGTNIRKTKKRKSEMKWKSKLILKFSPLKKISIKNKIEKLEETKKRPKENLKSLKESLIINSKLKNKV